MFGTCLWFQLIENHNINSIIKDTSKKFKTQCYLGHITMEYNIKNDISINPNNYILKDLHKIDKPYKTKNNNFYAIQQDYLFGNDTKKRFHISIIYRQNKDFTSDELDYLLKINLDNIIKKNDIIIKIMDCNSIFPEEWKDITHKYLI